MSRETSLKNEEVYLKLRLISNRVRFRILELTKDKQLNITELSSILKIAYTKCAEYVSMLESNGLIEKEKNGKEVFVKSSVTIEKDRIIFL